MPALINLRRIAKICYINVELRGWINLVKLGDSGFPDVKGREGVENTDICLATKVQAL